MYVDEEGNEVIIEDAPVMDNKFDVIDTEERITRMLGVNTYPVMQQEVGYDNTPIFVHSDKILNTFLPQIDVSEKIRRLLE